MTVADVRRVLERETGRDVDYFGVHIFGSNWAEQYMAVCNLESHEAKVLLGQRRIRIGWVRCRVRQGLTVIKCFKCLGYEHMKANCTGKDRTKCWPKCCETGHYAMNCASKLFTRYHGKHYE